MVEVDVSPMTKAHLRQVLRIERLVYPTGWSLTMYRQELSERNRVYSVATRRPGGDVLAYAGVIVVVGEGHVSTVATDPAWRRHGLATRLLLDVTRRAVADHGVRAMTLEVRVSNLGAQRLYERFGYRPAGIRKNYYSDSGEDAIVMWAHDVDGEDYSARLASIEAELADGEAA